MSHHKEVIPHIGEVEIYDGVLDKSNQQSEMIVWRKYPEEKPQEDKWYLLCFYGKDFYGKIYVRVEEAQLLYIDSDGYHWLIHGEDSIDEVEIIAFTEMPKGWK